MPAATPQITLTASLNDICGENAGTTASPAVLRIALAKFGLTLPCVPGTSNIGRVGPEDFYDDGSGISIPLWGNDVLTPPGTYYAITVLDGDGNIVQTGAYRFTGTETIDLSQATQIYPGPPTPPPSPIPTFAWDIVPTGTIDGSNAVFTLVDTPNPAASLNLFKDGSRMTAGIGFTLLGDEITYEADYIPQDGDSHICNYVYDGSTPPATATFAWDVVPTGTIDGTNAVFTLPQTPDPPESLNLFKNGARMTEGIAYTLSGANINYEADYIPEDGDTHICNFVYNS